MYAIRDPKEFIKLDDTIVKQIEFSNEPELQKARDIIKRLRKRDLYVFVNEYTVGGVFERFQRRPRRKISPLRTNPIALATPYRAA